MRLSTFALALLLSAPLSQAAKVSFTQHKRPNHSPHKRSGKTSFHRPVLAATSSTSQDGDVDLRCVATTFLSLAVQNLNRES